MARFLPFGPFYVPRRLARPATADQGSTKSFRATCAQYDRDIRCSLVMEKIFQELPHWTFHVVEVSLGCYLVTGGNALTGTNLEISGENPEQLLSKAKVIAGDLEQQSHRRRSKPCV